MPEVAKSLTIKAVGDVCLSEVDTDPFVHVSGNLKADIVFGNLECCLTTSDRGVKKQVVFSAPPERVAWLKTHGFNLVCLANNHVLDYGPEGLRDTLDAVRSEHLRFFGAGDHAEAASRTLRFDVDGVRIAVLGTVDAAGGDAAEPTVSTLSVRAMRERIESARREADLVIVSYHGGIELDTLPSPFVVRSLRGFVDAGADMVIGHHPHVLQPVEQYHDRLIIYSLGNFVFDNRRYGDQQALASKSMIVEARIDFVNFVDSVDSGGALRVDSIHYQMHPVFVGEDGMPRPLTAPGAEEFAADMAKLAESLDEVSVQGTDVQRIDSFASGIHTKSIRTIVRYAVRHAGDFSFAEILVGAGLVVKHAFKRVFRRAPRHGGRQS